jgi:4-aminobutyrate aminotransferase-like enzyme
MSNSVSTAATSDSVDVLMKRRSATLGDHSPIFYDEPLELVSGSGVWVRGADGVEYLDAYNNVPHVGHCNPVVVRALTEQAARLNINSRYLTETPLEYAEALLATFAGPLDRVLFTNSGSESNELALRIARQHTGHTGLLVSDFSYHGNTTSIAVATTGLRVREQLGPHVRTLHIPDGSIDDRPQSVILAEAVAAAQSAVDSLIAAGHGVSALLFDPLFSTEGLPRVPDGYAGAIAAVVQAASGLVIADEVQSGFGRTGSHMWGHEFAGLPADLVTLGKPMGNGHPLGAVITTAELLDEFGSRNRYFNTFAGNPVSAAVGQAVLAEMKSRDLQALAQRVGEHGAAELGRLAEQSPLVAAVRGSGMFLGLEIVDGHGAPSPHNAKWLIEDMRRRGVLVSVIGPHDHVLKIRPPLVFGDEHMSIFIDRLDSSLRALTSTAD